MSRQIFPVTRKEAEKQGISYSSENNRNSQFPTRLRELREGKGIPQITLSQVLGVSKSTVGLWENGDTLPDAKMVHDLAIYFDVSADYLLGLSDGAKHEYHDFARLTHFSPITIGNLMEISGHAHDEICFSRYRVAFEYLLSSFSFREIISLFCEYMDTTIPHGEVKDFDKMYIKLDNIVSDISKGNLHVVTSALLADAILHKAQQALIDAFSDAKKHVYVDGGWEQYMPK